MRKKYTKQTIIKEITLSGFLYALFIVMKLAFKEINLINGYSPQIQLIVLALGCYCLQTHVFRWCFLLLAFPFNIMFGYSGNLVFDYLIPTYGFFPFIYLNYVVAWVKKRHGEKKLNQNLFTILVIFIFHVISYGILGLSYTYSGVINYHATWPASFTINAPIAAISFIISLIIFYTAIEGLYYLKRWYQAQHSTTIITLSHVKRWFPELDKDARNLLYQIIQHNPAPINPQQAWMIPQLISERYIIPLTTTAQCYGDYALHPLRLWVLESDSLMES